MFLERFKEVENFTITKLPLGGSKTDCDPQSHKKNEKNETCTHTSIQTFFKNHVF